MHDNDDSGLDELSHIQVIFQMPSLNHKFCIFSYTIIVSITSFCIKYVSIPFFKTTYQLLRCTSILTILIPDIGLGLE